jgi:hypothetical protein
MRRVKIVILLPIAALIAMVAPAASAHAATTAQSDTTYTCYLGTPRAFNVEVTTVVNDQTTTTLANGTPIPGGLVAQSDPPYYPNVTSGLLVQTFVNETTGKSITRNVSGTNWFTYDQTPKVPGDLATGTYVTVGPNAQLFGPLSQAALSAAGTPEPMLVFTNGLLVMHFVIPSTGLPNVTSFALKGTQQNGCALLSG